MNSSLYRRFGRSLLLAAVAGSIFVSQVPAEATLQLTCTQTVSIWNDIGGTGGLAFDATGEAFNGYPFTVQNISVQLYYGTTLESTTYTSTTTSSPEWIVSSVPFPSDATGYTLKVTDTSVTPNVSISMPLWSPPETYSYTVYTDGSTGIEVDINDGTGGISGGTLYLASSSGGTPFASVNGTWVSGTPSIWKFAIGSLSAATTYYWGLSSTSCTNGIGTTYP